MKDKLEVGTELRGQKSKYTVTNILSDSGGQGGVYSAKDMKGKTWAIKWYWEFEVEQHQRIYDLFLKQAPAALNNSKCNYIWPYDILRNPNSFGYVMELLPLNQFVNYENIIVNSGNVNYDTLCELSITLCNGFNALHSSGYCYKDISRDNIYFDLKTDTVYILDVDNIRHDSATEKSDVLGTPGFIAPEIIRREASPNTASDKFSLSVMLFQLWVKQHPFDGIYKVEYMGTNENQDIYANPIFIYHPTDKTNTVEIRPKYAPDLFNFVNYWWSVTPQKLKDLFIKAFTDGLDPKQRIPESVWRDAFIEIKNSGLMKCSHCGKLISNEVTTCVYCNKSVKPKPQNVIPPQPKAAPQQQPSPTPTPKPVETRSNVIVVYEDNHEVKEFSIVKGIKLYGKDLSQRLMKFDEFLEICTKPNDESVLAIRNVTYYNWTVKDINGAEKTLPAGRAVPINLIKEIICLSGVSCKVFL